MEIWMKGAIGIWPNQQQLCNLKMTQDWQFMKRV